MRCFRAPRKYMPPHLILALMMRIFYYFRTSSIARTPAPGKRRNFCRQHFHFSTRATDFFRQGEALRRRPSRISMLSSAPSSRVPAPLASGEDGRAGHDWLLEARGRARDAALLRRRFERGPAAQEADTSASSVLGFASTTASTNLHAPGAMATSGRPFHYDAAMLSHCHISRHLK